MSQNKNQNIEKTILTIVVGFLLIYVLSKWKWAIMVSISVGLIGVFSSYLSQKIDWIWKQITKLLSLIIPNILLSLVFYIVLFPVAILSRLFSKNDALNIKGGKETYYKIESKHFNADVFNNPW